MSNNISIYLMFLALLFSQLAASEQNYSNPFEDMILAGNSSLALSENLNEKPSNIFTYPRPIIYYTYNSCKPMQRTVNSIIPFYTSFYLNSTITS